MVVACNVMSFSIAITNSQQAYNIIVAKRKCAEYMYVVDRILHAADSHHHRRSHRIAFV